MRVVKVTSFTYLALGGKSLPELGPQIDGEEVCGLNLFNDYIPIISNAREVTGDR